jgi:hypothetical protein
VRLLKTIAQREIWAVAMLLAGGGALCYGWLFRTVEVFQEEEREETVWVPAPFGAEAAPSEQPPAPEGADPFRSPPDEPPGVVKQKITAKYWQPHFQPEWVVVRDVTFGGLTRFVDVDKDGKQEVQLRRTYTGTPPSLCPT